MSGALPTAGLLAVSAAITGWCTWHCLRGMRAMTGANRSTAEPRAATDAELARLRAEVTDLRAHRQPAPPNGPHPASQATTEPVRPVGSQG